MDTIGGTHPLRPARSSNADRNRLDVNLPTSTSVSASSIISTSDSSASARPSNVPLAMRCSILGSCSAPAPTRNRSRGSTSHLNSGYRAVSFITRFPSVARKMVRTLYRSASAFTRGMKAFRPPQVRCVIAFSRELQESPSRTWTPMMGR